MKFFSLVVMFLLTTSVVLAEKETDQSKIKNFFENGTEIEQLIADLRYSDRAIILKALTPYLKSKENFEQALDIALQLRVSGAHSLLKKHVEEGTIEAGSTTHSKLIELAFRTNDKVVANYYNLLKKTDNDSVKTILQAAFYSLPVELELLEKMYKDWGEMDDGEMKMRLGSIIQTQMCLDHDITHKEWKKDLQEFKVKGQQFKIKGYDIFKYADYSSKLAFMTGPNFTINRSGSIGFSLKHDFWQKKNLKIRLRYHSDMSAMIEVGLICGEGRWEAITTKTNWRMQSKNATEVKRKDGWNEVLLTVTDRTPEGKTPQQLLSFQIGGLELLPSGGITNGGLESVYIRCEEGSIIVGGLEIE